MKVIRRETTIEDLVEALPESVGYLLGKGMQPIVCGGPIWATLEEAAKGKGYTDPQIDEIVADPSVLRAGEDQARSRRRVPEPTTRIPRDQSVPFD